MKCQGFAEQSAPKAVVCKPGCTRQSQLCWASVCVTCSYTEEGGGPQEKSRGARLCLSPWGAVSLGWCFALRCARVLTCPERSQSRSKSTYSSSLLYMPRLTLSGFPSASRRNFSLHRLSKSLDRWRLTWFGGETPDFAPAGCAQGPHHPGLPRAVLSLCSFLFLDILPPHRPLPQHQRDSLNPRREMAQPLSGGTFLTPVPEDGFSSRRFHPRPWACIPKPRTQNLNDPPGGSLPVPLGLDD